MNLPSMNQSIKTFFATIATAAEYATAFLTDKNFSLIKYLAVRLETAYAYIYSFAPTALTNIRLGKNSCL